VNSTTACDTAPGTGGYQADQDGIVICGAGSVNITGLTIDPAWASGTCYDSLYGILVGGGRDAQPHQLLDRRRRCRPDQRLPGRQQARMR
jgi:hypothetical protein